MGRITRREFLFRAAGLAALYGLGRRLPLPAWGATPVAAASLPTAVVARGTNADSTEAILKAALEGLGGIGRFVQAGQTVAIKVNATWAYPPFTASSSDPDLIKSLVTIVRAAGAGRVIVMDHCAIDPGTADCLRVSGIGAAVKELGVENLFPNLTDGPRSLYTPIDLPQGKAFSQLRVIKAAAEADVRINLALAKSHNVTKMTLCLKHMMGLLEAPGLLHANLEQGIVDLSTPSPIRADLHILEAIRVRLPLGDYRVCAGPETEQTNPKVVKRFNQIAAGTDPALIDAYASQTYFGMQPQELNYLTLAAESGVGEIDPGQAAQAGRLLVFDVGQAIATPTAEATAAPTQGEAASEVGTAAIATPLPTPTADLTTGEAAPPDSAPTDSAGEVVSPNAFLSGALVPVAVITAGAGLVAAKRLKREQKEPDDGHPQG